MRIYTVVAAGFMILFGSSFIFASLVDVINPGTQNWVQAAKTGRADMLILGDSMVLHESQGWDWGFNHALQNDLGLAGSGLQQGWGGEGAQFAISPYYGSNFYNGTGAPVTPGYEGYNWRSSAATAASVPQGTLLGEVTSSAPRSLNGYDWTLYTANSAGASLTATARYGESPYTVYSTAAVPLPQTSGTNLSKVTLHYASPANPALAEEFNVHDVVNSTIFYSRITVPGGTGATVTSWGYGGHATPQFQSDYWNGPNWSQAGKTAWLNALVDGGSGKLNVVVAEGFNDRNLSGTNADGLPANSPGAFADNIRAFIAQIRADWAIAGHNSSNLSFTLLGMYQDYYESLDPTAPLLNYSLQEQAIAQSDPQISFVGLYDKAPNYNTAVGDGYMYDEVHADGAGVAVYSQMAVDALVGVPEPATLGLVGISVLLLLRRNSSPRFTQV